MKLIGEKMAQQRPNLFNSQTIASTDSVVKTVQNLSIAASKTEVDTPVKHFNRDDIQTAVIFPDNLAPDIAAKFLILIDAYILAAPGLTTDTTRYVDAPEYLFIANNKRVRDFINTYGNFDNIKNNDTLVELYQALVKGNKKINLDQFDVQDSMELLELHENAGINEKVLSKTLPNVRDKINFVYSLCSDISQDDKLTQSQLHVEKIFQQFILQRLHQIAATDNPKKRDYILRKLMRNTIFVDTKLSYKLNQFLNNLGTLKIAEKLSMIVVTDDGMHNDLFNLDLSKPHNIMNSVNLSKINKPVDLRNITINGDFVCNKAKQPVVMPRQINGTMDLSNYDFVSKMTRIPDCVTSVNFSHSIKTIDELLSLNIKFPESVTEILLAHTHIKQMVKNANGLKQYEIFKARYPNITIRDSQNKVSVDEILAQIQQTQKQPVPVPVSTPDKKETFVAKKDDNWLTRKEIITILKQDEICANITDIDRLVRIATKTVHSEKRDNNGTIVLCIHQDNINAIKEQIIKLLEQAPQEQPEPQKEVVVKEEKKPTKTKQNNVVIKIEKYIPKQVWKSICSNCGDSIHLLYSVLERINKVNMNYTTQTPQLPIQFVDKDRKKKYTPNTEVKSGKAATQHIENNDNRRIVWTINPDDKIMVATAFFADHGDNAQSMKLYNSIAIPNAKQGRNMDGILVNKELVIKNEYLKVSKLLKEYKAKIAEKEQKTTKADSAESQKRKRIKQHTTLVDVKAVETQIDAFIEHLDNEIKELTKNVLNNTDNPKIQLQNAQKIVKLLTEKVSLKQK